MSAPTVDELIDKLGGNITVARLLGRSRQAVCMWRKRGFPRDIDTILKLEAALRAKGVEVKPYLARPGSLPRPAPAEGAAA